MVCALDDDLSQLGIATRLGVTPILRRNEANKGYEQELGRWFVSDLHQAQEVILHLIEQHKNGTGIYA